MIEMDPHRRGYAPKATAGRSLALIAACIGIALLVPLGHPACAADNSDPDLLHIHQTRWGFDGTIQKRTFVPLSIQVQNVSSQPWRGTLRVTRHMGGDKRLGAIVEEDVALQPDETRWVQIVPYVLDEFESWKLAWGPEKRHQIELPATSAGPRPTVLIYDEDAVTPPGGVLRRMPEHLFPTAVTATDGLRGVILNAPPFWQGARAQAFLDWLARGGRVYLLHDDQGRFPVFSAPLQVLNQERDRYRVGQGHVRRLPVKVADLDIAFAQRQIFNDDWTDEMSIQFQRALPGVDQWGYPASIAWQRDSGLFLKLSRLAQFDRRWWLIDLCVVAYLLALFPVCYRIGRRAADVRLFYVAFFSSAVLFSVVFGLLGQVGGAARNRIRSAAVVRPLEGKVHDVTQWSQLAAVHGGTYLLQFPGSGTWFSTCQELEEVSGILRGGLHGTVELKMPPASMRTLLHRRKLSIDRPPPAIVSRLVEGAQLGQLNVSIEGCFQDAPYSAAAICEGAVYPLKLVGSQLELDSTKPRAMLTACLLRPVFLQAQSFSLRSGATKPPAAPPLGPVRQDDDRLYSERQRYEALFLPLLGNALGLTDTIDGRVLHQFAGSILLAVLVPMTAEFHVDSAEFPDQAGAALFLYEFPPAGE